MLKRDREREQWDSIDYNFMTEESECEDGTVVQHLLPWRSECKLMVNSAMYIHYPACLPLTFPPSFLPPSPPPSFSALNKLVRRLDKRCDKQDKLSNCKRKPRVPSVDSCLPIPANAPQWSIKTLATGQRSRSPLPESTGSHETPIASVSQGPSTSSSVPELDSE